MPRKSRELRLAETVDLISKYEEAGLSTDRVCNFARQMKSMLERKKALSPRRRIFLDKVIAEGVPEPKGDLEYIAKIDEAIETPGIEKSDVLLEFKGKLMRGWDLSEKQKAWCDALIYKAQTIRDGTYWKPSDELTERIKLAVSCYVCYSGTYWETHPAGWRAMSRARSWVAGDVSIIDERTVEKLFKSVAGKLREMENPKFAAGAIAYYKNRPGIILEGPIPTTHGIGYDVLVDGEIKRSVNLNKRRRK